MTTEYNYNQLNYEATNTAADFHKDNSFVRLLIGPVGTGKSVACCIEPLIKAVQQAPGFDGIRRTRWAVVRNTYPQLKSTTIKTWQSWYNPLYFGNVKWDSPITHMIKFNDVEMEVIFIALDNYSDIDKLRSLELTGAYLNELQYLPEMIFEVCKERVNRFPSKKEGAPITWAGIIADTNAPSSKHWIYRKFEKSSPEGYKLFRYDSALLRVDSVPENMKHAVSMNGTIYANNMDADYRRVQNDEDYWIKLVPGYTDEQIKVNLMGEYGVVISGTPVHPTYNDKLHYSNQELKANPLIELGLGWDFGLTPACAIVQLSPRGKLIVLDELVTERMGLRDFVELIVIPHLNMHYPFWRANYISRHDPAGSMGSQTDERSCEDILREFEINSLSASTNNNPTPRRDGLKYFLGRLTDGEPAFSISTRAQVIREGLMGHFQYDRLKVSSEDGQERYHEKPLKNMYSHICEALEYIAMHYSAETKKPVASEVKPYRIHTGSFFGR